MPHDAPSTALLPDAANRDARPVPTDPPDPDCPQETTVQLAGRLLASQPGSAARALDRHRPRTDGRCSGCTVTLQRWPCFVVLAARAAVGLESRASKRTLPTGREGTLRGVHTDS
jgi:hypothetical protein